MSEVNIFSTTFDAGADLRDKEGYFGRIHTDGSLILGTNGSKNIGVITQGGNLGESCGVKILGEDEVICGEEITAGDKIASDSNGKAKKATVSDSVSGVARDSGAIGEFVTVILLPGV